MKKLYLPAVSHNLVGTLARAGYLLQEGDRILDMGCGSGGLVIRLRELGFEAYGFDIAPFWKERPAEQQAWFHALAPEAPAPYAPLGVPYKLPFDDGFFDVVLSTQVIEHVPDLDSFFGEACRVIKTEGIMANIYPSRSCWIEWHTLVPFYPWLRADFLIRWAAKLGIRNAFQKELSSDVVTWVNQDYLRGGVFMYSAAHVNQAALKYFGSMQNMDRAFYADRPRGLRLLWAYIQAARADKELPLRGAAYFQRMELPLYKKKAP